MSHKIKRNHLSYFVYSTKDFSPTRSTLKGFLKLLEKNKPLWKRFMGRKMHIAHINGHNQGQIFVREGTLILCWKTAAQGLLSKDKLALMLAYLS